MKPPSVFIIASNADYAPAWRVHQRLSEGGVNCFFCDEAQLRAGEKGYQARAERALETAEGLVVVAGSRERVDSEWVRHIWRRYLDTPGQTRPVATVRCDGLAEADLPRTLRRGGSLVFPEDLGSLSTRLARPPEKQRPVAASPPARRTMRFLAVVTLINVLILGTVIWLIVQNGGKVFPGQTPSLGAAESDGGGNTRTSPNDASRTDRRHTGDAGQPDSPVPKAGTGTAGTANDDDAANYISTVPAPLGPSDAVNSVNETPAAGTPLYLNVNNVRLPFVFIPPGKFMMGSPPGEVRRGLDEPQHTVEITRGFWMARTECIQALWQNVMNTNPSKFTGHGEMPVDSVSWYDMAGSRDSFLIRMNNRHLLPKGWSFALPTEAQWEYACRAGTQTPFYCGQDLTSALANIDGLIPYDKGEASSFLGRTARAGSYPPNPWGLYDMHGNVREWCADAYTHQPAGTRDPFVPSGPDGRVVRGGSWWYQAWHCRSASRESVSEGLASDHTQGFRLAIVQADSR